MVKNWLVALYSANYFHVFFFTENGWKFSHLKGEKLTNRRNRWYFTNIIWHDGFYSFVSLKTFIRNIGRKHKNTIQNVVYVRFSEFSVEKNVCHFQTNNHGRQYGVAVILHTFVVHHHPHRVARPSVRIAVSTSWRHFERFCACTHSRCVETKVMGPKVELYCTEPCPPWSTCPASRFRTLWLVIILIMVVSETVLLVVMARYS